MMDLLFSRRAEDLDTKYLDAAGSASARAMLTCVMPLSEIVTDFFDKLKRIVPTFNFEAQQIESLPSGHLRDRQKLQEFIYCALLVHVADSSEVCNPASRLFTVFRKALSLETQRRSWRTFASTFFTISLSESPRNMVWICGRPGKLWWCGCRRIEMLIIYIIS